MKNFFEHVMDVYFVYLVLFMVFGVLGWRIDPMHYVHCLLAGVPFALLFGGCWAHGDYLDEKEYRVRWY